MTQQEHIELLEELVRESNERVILLEEQTEAFVTDGVLKGVVS